MSKVGRLDVISSGAQRRWTLEEKQRIVAESVSLWGVPPSCIASFRRE
jgi:hypothetical protein